MKIVDRKYVLLMSVMCLIEDVSYYLD